MIDEENMDKVFLEALESFSKEPPAYIWDGIRERMTVAVKKRRLTWYRWSAVAALLALAFIAGWYFIEKPGEMTPQISETDVAQSKDDLLPVEKEIVSPTDHESSSEITAARIPEIIFPKPATKRLVYTASDDDIPIEDKNREYIRSASTDLTLMERIEVAQVTRSGPERSLSLPERWETKSSAGFPRRKRDITEAASSKLLHVNEQHGRWKLGVSVSPGYSSYQANHTAAYAGNMTYEASDGNGNLSGGISFQYKTGRRLSLESGIYYASNGQKTTSSPQFFGGRAQSDFATDTRADELYFNTPVAITNNHFSMNSTAGIIEFEQLPGNAEIEANLEKNYAVPGSLLIQGELTQVFDFVEVPLYLRFLIVDSKIDVEMMGGLNAGLVVGNHVYIDNEFGNQDIGKTRDISTVNVSGTFGLGLTYALGRHFSLAVEPRMNYYMNSINHNPDVEFHPYRVGIYTGLYYAF